MNARIQTIYQCMLSCGHTLKMFIQGLAAADCRQMDGELVTLENLQKIVLLKGYFQDVGEFLNIFTGNLLLKCRMSLTLL